MTHDKWVDKKKKKVVLNELMAPGISFLAVSVCLEIPSPTLQPKSNDKSQMVLSVSAGRRMVLMTREGRNEGAVWKPEAEAVFLGCCFYWCFRTGCFRRVALAEQPDCL